ncbi:type II toxin-antitoxin system VapC family toxin [Streptomyces sp. NPDC006739]|uniref:type II toxin-antitoxin system VapC family toxin n=1 Tax=Streptomyces sp. NPDC006739 TaxID=3364763 RepID=UPI0036D0A82A
MSGALVLDSEGLAKAVRRDREVHEWLTAARDADLPVVTSAAVLVEVIHPKINEAALKWTLSRIRVEPVTQGLAQAAATLLWAAGLRGHKYAIDAKWCDWGRAEGTPPPNWSRRQANPRPLTWGFSWSG